MFSRFCGRRLVGCSNPRPQPVVDRDPHPNPYTRPRFRPHTTPKPGWLGGCVQTHNKGSGRRRHEMGLLARLRLRVALLGTSETPAEPSKHPIAFIGPSHDARVYDNMFRFRSTDRCIGRVRPRFGRFGVHALVGGRRARAVRCPISRAMSHPHLHRLSNTSILPSIAHSTPTPHTARQAGRSTPGMPKPKTKKPSAATKATAPAQQKAGGGAGRGGANAKGKGRGKQGGIDEQELLAMVQAAAAARRRMEAAGG